MLLFSSLSNSLLFYLALKNAEMIDMKESSGRARMVFHCPTRCLVGYRVLSYWFSDQVYQRKEKKRKEKKRKEKKK